MEDAHEKVCRRCGALNDERSLMCVRCGETLEMTEEKKYEVFKGKMLSSKLFLFLFAVSFIVYSFGVIFYGFPWIYDKLLWLGETYIFNLYEELNILYIMLEVLYTTIVFVFNYATIAIILYSVIGSRLMKKSKLNGTCTFVFIYMILSFILMTIYKHKLDYIIIIEHFMSIIITFPYIKMKILRRSI